MKKYIGMLIIAGLCGSASAAVVTTSVVSPSGVVGDTTDLFQNATVTASSPTNTQFLLFDVRDLFTAGNAVMQNDVVFADTNGTVHFVEFNTAQSVSVRRLRVLLSNDNENGDFSQQRSLINFKFYVRDTTGAFTVTELAADVNIEENYTAAYGGSTITAEVIFPSATTGQYFRVEFEQPVRPWEYAPRVVEVDALDWAFEEVGVGTASFGAGDPLDDFQLATVTSNTATYPVPTSAPIADLFTAESPITSDWNVIFADGVGSFGIVDFNISEPRSVTNMTFLLRNDDDPAVGGPHNRATSYIKIYASLFPGDVLDHIVVATLVDPDYQVAYSATNQTKFSIDFVAPVNAQYFRAEIGFFTSGSRIGEIDGYGAPYTPPPATIISLTPVSSTVLKMVVDAPGSAAQYAPKATTDLISVAPSAVAHSDNMAGPFTIANLGISASEGTNKVIYVEADAANKFYSIEYGN